LIQETYPVDRVALHLGLGERDLETLVSSA
jgi:hypothetical protein